jgi:N-acetylmuramoyl-L-alanine amidase
MKTDLIGRTDDTSELTKNSADLGQLMDIQNHRLTGDRVSFSASPNRGAGFAAKLPDTVVIHYTAGASLESSVKTLSTPGSNASAHVVVGRDGTIVQLVPFDVIAWHAGASSLGGRTGLNKYSIGIEIDNAGRLTQTASGDFLTWFNRRIAREDAMQGVHRNEVQPAWWHVFTEAQVERVTELVTLLIKTYPITIVVGHEEIAPGRKSDPGPAFPLDRLRDRWLGAGRKEDAPAPPPPPPPAVAVAAVAAVPVTGGSGKPKTGGTGKPGSRGKRKPGSKKPK